METASVVADLFILFAAAKILGELFEHFGQPAVVGELLAGVLVGPHVFGWISEGGGSEVLELLAELGVVILLFTVGLETSIRELRQVGRSALVVGSLGVILPFALGVALMATLGYGQGHVLFVAAALTATSVGVTARVFKDLAAIKIPPAQVVLGAAVVDDILALLVLAVVTGIAAGSFSTIQIVSLLGVIAAFLGVVLLAGPRVVRRLREFAHLPIIPGSPLAFAMLLTLGLAALSETIGLAAIIGAFLAGLIFEFRKQEVVTQVEPIYEFLVPFFFAVTGTHLDPGVFTQVDILGLSMAVTAIAVVTKLAGGYFGALSLGKRDALLVGTGMIPRGEVGLIVASLGLSRGIIGTDLFGVVLVMTVITTVVTPPFLAPMIRRRPPDPKKSKGRR